jgi:ABC-type sugar transport system permease subunit
MRTVLVDMAHDSNSPHLRERIGAWLEREAVLGYVLTAPTILILLVFVAYPFFLGIWFSLTDKWWGRRRASSAWGTSPTWWAIRSSSARW